MLLHKGKGKHKASEVNFPTGKKVSSVDIYSRTYKSPSQADARDRSYYGKMTHTQLLRVATNTHQW